MTRIDLVLASLLLLILPLVLLVSPLGAQERVTLTTPITKPSQTDVKVDQVNINLTTNTFEIRYLGTNGEAGSAVYSTPAVLNNCTPQVLQVSGQQLISTINTMNFTTNSFVKRILQRLQTDCYIGAGAVAGTPQ